MNLKNYTTEVPASRSLESIEKLLVEFGSTNIMKEYNNSGAIISISFILAMDNMKLPFRLPAKVDNCYKWLKKKKPQSQEKNLRQQAERIVWKQMHEWIYLQLSLVEMDQAERLEVLFPFLHDVAKNKTYYEQVKEGKFKALMLG